MARDKSGLFAVGAELFGSTRRLLTGIYVANLQEPYSEPVLFSTAEVNNWIRETYRIPAQGTSFLYGFKNLGMLHFVGDRDDLPADRNHYWERLDNPVWDLFLMAEVVLGESGATKRKFWIPTEDQLEEARAELLEIQADLAVNRPLAVR